MDSNQPNLDLELIAALIDGRLSGEQRAGAVRLLADSDDAMEIFATAVRYQHAVESDDSTPKVVAPRPMRRWRVAVPIAAAAALAIVVVPVVLKQPGGDVATQYALALSQNPRFASGLPAGWDAHGWSVTRGVNARQTATLPGESPEPTIAFRLGVQSVDLDVAVRRGDTALARRVIGQIVDVLGSVALSQSVELSYNELAKGLSSEPLPKSVARASNAERELRNTLNGSPWYSFGAWSSAATLATQLRDTAFFQSTHGAAFVRSAMPAADLAPQDSAALQLIDDRVNAGPSERGFAEMHDALRATIRRRGG
jgi:hypothetical protein